MRAPPHPGHRGGWRGAVPGPPSSASHAPVHLSTCGLSAGSAPRRSGAGWRMPPRSCSLLAPRASERGAGGAHGRDTGGRLHWHSLERARGSRGRPMGGRHRQRARRSDGGDAGAGVGPASRGGAPAGAPFQLAGDRQSDGGSLRRGHRVANRQGAAGMEQGRVQLNVFDNSWFSPGGSLLARMVWLRREPRGVSKLGTLALTPQGLHPPHLRRPDWRERRHQAAGEHQVSMASEGWETDPGSGKGSGLTRSAR